MRLGQQSELLARQSQPWGKRGGHFQSRAVLTSCHSVTSDFQDRTFPMCDHCLRVLASGLGLLEGDRGQVTGNSISAQLIWVLEHKWLSFIKKTLTQAAHAAHWLFSTAIIGKFSSYSPDFVGLVHFPPCWWFCHTQTSVLPGTFLHKLFSNSPVLCYSDCLRSCWLVTGSCWCSALRGSHRYHRRVPGAQRAPVFTRGRRCRGAECIVETLGGHRLPQWEKQEVGLISLPQD